eukprot:9193987-Pyramimonas_sp.AAC.1
MSTQLLADLTMMLQSRCTAAWGALAGKWSPAAGPGRWAPDRVTLARPLGSGSKSSRAPWWGSTASMTATCT